MKLSAVFLIVFFAALAAANAPFARAQDARKTSEDWQTFPYALGGGIETNMNAREGWAVGFGAAADRHITKYLTAGLRGMMTTQEGIISTEAWLFARLYVFKMGAGGAFTQLGGGISFFQEEDRRPTSFLLEYSAGYRYFFLRGFYAEAAVRMGFPFQWGLGLTAGHWFNF
ncbi:MAG: hypothetical protein LBQ55_09250 [Treponema sp.]|jgi:hypothetical protein|nr:hypothetical protein [Treponema sp.]